MVDFSTLPTKYVGLLHSVSPSLPSSVFRTQSDILQIVFSPTELSTVHNVHVEYIPLACVSKYLILYIWAYNAFILGMYVHKLLCDHVVVPSFMSEGSLRVLLCPYSLQLKWYRSSSIRYVMRGGHIYSHKFSNFFIVLNDGIYILLALNC